MTAGDSIENQAAVTAAKAALSLTAQKDIAQQGDATAGTSVLMDSQKQGNIAVTGDVTSGTSTALKTKDGSITAGTGTTAALTSETGDITVHGTVTAQEGARLQAVEQGSLLIDGDLLATESGDAEALTNSGDITINGKVESRAGNVVIETLKGDVAVDGQVTAEQGSAKVRSAQGNVKVSGQMKAGTDLMAQSDKGSVTIDGSLTSGRAALARAVDGDVTIGGSVTGGTSVTAQAEEGNITVSGSMEARNGGLTLTASDSRELADKGNISVNGTLTASQAAAVSTDHGSIAIGTEEKDGTVTAGTTAELTSETGDIIVQGTVASRQGAKLSTARKGDILVKGSLLAAESGDAEARTQEDVLLSTARGDAAVTGRVKAGQDVKASADLGNMTFQGTLEAGRDISARTGRGNMDFAGSLTSGRDLTAVTEESGNMVFNGLADAGRNFLADARQEGTITLRKDIRSGMDASFHTNDGSLLFAGVDLSAAEDIHVTADTGSVTLSTTGRGDIKDSHRQANGDRAFVSAPAGNVTIRHTGVGDVDLYSLYAHKDAGVEVADGNLYLDTVNGDLVAVLVKNARKVLDVEHMVAGTGIRMTGADMSVDDVLQRVDSQGNLTLTLDGASEDMPIESLAIGDIKSNTGVRFPRLWLRKGSVQVSEGEFLMDKLMILDKAIFSNGTMVTHVFGTTPVADQAATSVYWNNTRLNRPQEFLGEWRNDNGLSGRWMYLNFDRQGHTQFSNGNLLDLDPHNYVYNQRYRAIGISETSGPGPTIRN